MSGCEQKSSIRQGAVGLYSTGERSSNGGYFMELSIFSRRRIFQGRISYLSNSISGMQAWPCSSVSNLVRPCHFTLIRCRLRSFLRVEGENPSHVMKRNLQERGSDFLQGRDAMVLRTPVREGSWSSSSCSKETGFPRIIGFRS